MSTGLYFDYCATTPVDHRVLEKMLPTLQDNFGNPSSMHAFGRLSAASMQGARQEIAAGIGANPDEIFFTSGATEANNLALFGVLRHARPDKNHLILSAIEHHAVLYPAQALESQGFEITYLPVDRDGFVSADTLEQNIRPTTALVSIMMVNNEVGTIQDIPRLANITHDHGAAFHTDAVQAIPCLEVNVDELNVDLLSLSSHKMYGPKGVGVLYVRSGTAVDAITFGGSQERKLRPGTENVPGIVGFGTAMSLRTAELKDRQAHLKRLRTILIEGLTHAIPDCRVHGSPGRIAPHVVSATFPGVDGELALFHLSQLGVAVSLGSACTSEDLEPSHVLTAMGLSPDEIDGTLRISLGDPTTEEEIKQLLEILPVALSKAKLNQGNHG
jgi:cysteine desulfurase